MKASLWHMTFTYVWWMFLWSFKVPAKLWHYTYSIWWLCVEQNCEDPRNVSLVNNILQMLVFVAMFTVIATVKDIPYEIYLRFFSIMKEFNPQSFCGYCFTRLKTLIVQYLTIVMQVAAFLWVVSWTDSFLWIQIAVISFITIKHILFPVLIHPFLLRFDPIKTRDEDGNVIPKNDLLNKEILSMSRSLSQPTDKVEISNTGA
jgi:hypothetical protein